jgi:hypothetical protein
MKEEKTIDIYNKNQAKRIIDCMFDAKIFAEHITRDDMNGFEDLIAFEFQCQSDSSHKIAEFTVKWNLKKDNK